MKAIAFIISNNWFDKNLNREEFSSCFNLYDHGDSNGYVAIPPTNKYYGKDYREIDGLIKIHGGLTFSGSTDLLNFDNVEFCSYEGELPNGLWVFGFDTFHLDDNSIVWNKDACKKEAIELAIQLEEGETNNA
jgi:hypothetical protein